MDIDVAFESGAKDVLPEEPGGVGFGDRLLENVLDVVELAADIDVSDFRADRIAADRTAFDQQVRIALHQQVIFERPRFAFVGVTGDVARLDLLVDETPLQTGRKSRAAAAAQARGLHQIDDRIGRLAKRFLQRVIALVPAVKVEGVAVRFADVLRQDRFHYSHD